MYPKPLPPPGKDAGRQLLQRCKRIQNALTDQEIKSARDDFMEFRARVGRDNEGRKLITDNYSLILGSTLTHCWNRGLWINHKSPPQLGKSTDLRLFFLWQIGHDINTITGIISGDESSAIDGCSFCREIMLKTSFRTIFKEAKPDYERSRTTDRSEMDDPEIKDSRGWKKSSWFLQREGQSKDPTMGAYANVPKREDLSLRILMADDLITERTANSQAERERIENAFWKTWIEGRISKDGGWVAHLQNHRFDGDLGDKIRDDPRFVSLYVGVTSDCHRMFVRVWNAPEDLPLILDPSEFHCDEVQPRDNAQAEFEFPLPFERGANWTQQGLMARNASARAQLYHLIGHQPEDLIFPSFAGCARSGKTVSATMRIGDRGGYPIMTERDRITWIVAGGLDLSGDKRRGNVLTFIAKDQSHKKYPLFHARFRQMEEIINALDILWGNGIEWFTLKVENNGVQSTIVDMLKVIARHRNVPWMHRIEGFMTGQQKMHADQGLPALDPMFSNGEIVWPDGESRRSDTPFAKDWLVLETDLSSTTRSLVSQPGKTPDSIMSFWFAQKTIDSRTSACNSGLRIGIARRAYGAAI